MSHVLQQIAAAMWDGPDTGELLARATRSYAERRSGLVGLLADRGITAYGSSGLGVWIPVAEEVATVQRLLDRGWAVSPGERFRFRAGPGIRVTTAALAPTEAAQLADALRDIVGTPAVTYAG